MMKINLIITCYNSASTVIKTLDSCFDQSMQSFEKQIIVIDDCSTDESYQILKQYKRGKPNLLLLKNEENFGAQTSRNKALTYVREDEYFLCVDSDDYIESNILENMMNHIRNSSLDGLCFKRTVYLRDETFAYQISNQIKGEIVSLDDLISSDNGFLTTVNFICSKAAYTKVSGYNSRCMYDTQQFGLAIVAAGFNIGIHKNATYFARLRKESFFNRVTETGNGNYFSAMVLWQIFNRFSDQTILDLISDKWLEFNIKSKNQLWDYLVLVSGGHGLFIDELSNSQPRHKDVAKFLRCISEASADEFISAKAAKELENYFGKSEFISLIVSILRGVNNSKPTRLRTKIKNKLFVFLKTHLLSKIEYAYFSINTFFVANFFKKSRIDRTKEVIEANIFKIKDLMLDQYGGVQTLEERKLHSLFGEMESAKNVNLNKISKILYPMNTVACSNRQTNKKFLECKKMFGKQLTENILSGANPFGLEMLHRNKKISPVALDNLTKLSVLQAECPNLLFRAKTIAEFGGGIGERAEIIRKINPRSTYLIFTTPTYSFLQFAYLSTLFPNEVVLIKNANDAVRGKISILPVRDSDKIQNTNRLAFDLILMISNATSDLVKTDKLVGELGFHDTECAFIYFDKSKPILAPDCEFFKKLTEKGLRRATRLIQRSNIDYVTIYRR